MERKSRIDLAAAVLQGARQRLAAHHSTDEYIDDDDAVCGIGGILAVEGVTRAMADRWQSVEGGLEKFLSDAARDAISLLNAKAVELYPASAEHGRWCGPLEWVNQSYDRCEVSDPLCPDCIEARERAKAAILGIYDAVVLERATVSA